MHPSVLEENDEWVRGIFYSEFKVRECGKVLQKTMFTPKVIGTGVHGFMRAGKEGDQKWYKL